MLLNISLKSMPYASPAPRDRRLVAPLGGMSHCCLKLTVLPADTFFHLTALLKHAPEFFLRAWHYVLLDSKTVKAYAPPKFLVPSCYVVVQFLTVQEVQPLHKAGMLLSLTFMSACFVWFLLRSASFSCPTRLFAILRTLVFFFFFPLCNHFGSGAVSSFSLEHVLLPLPATAFSRGCSTQGPAVFWAAEVLIIVVESWLPIWS